MLIRWLLCLSKRQQFSITFYPFLEKRIEWLCICAQIQQHLRVLLDTRMSGIAVLGLVSTSGRRFFHTCPLMVTEIGMQHSEPRPQDAGIPDIVDRKSWYSECSEYPWLRHHSELFRRRCYKTKYRWMISTINLSLTAEQTKWHRQYSPGSRADLLMVFLPLVLKDNVLTDYSPHRTIHKQPIRPRNEQPHPRDHKSSQLPKTNRHLSCPERRCRPGSWGIRSRIPRVEDNTSPDTRATSFQTSRPYRTGFHRASFVGGNRCWHSLWGVVASQRPAGGGYAAILRGMGG